MSDQNALLDPLTEGKGLPAAPAAGDSRTVQAILSGELQEVEAAVRSASTAEELQALKAELLPALDRLKQQTRGREQAAAHLLAVLQERLIAFERSNGAAVQHAVQPDREVPSAKSPLDPVTGLPSQAAAEAAILALRPEDRSKCYVTALHLRRMKAVHARFGEKLSNELLLFCAQQIAQLVILSTDQLFRWTGPGTFVALLKREGPLLTVRQEMGRILAGKMTFESTNGAVLLPVSVSTQVMHASAHGGPALLEGLEKFFSIWRDS